jgi:hypothetical protein
MRTTPLVTGVAASPAGWRPKWHHRREGETLNPPRWLCRVALLGLLALPFLVLSPPAQAGVWQVTVPVLAYPFLDVLSPPPALSTWIRSPDVTIYYATMPVSQDVDEGDYYTRVSFDAASGVPGKSWLPVPNDDYNAIVSWHLSGLVGQKDDLYPLHGYFAWTSPDGTTSGIDKVDEIVHYDTHAPEFTSLKMSQLKPYLRGQVVRMVGTFTDNKSPACQVGMAVFQGKQLVGWCALVDTDESSGQWFTVGTQYDFALGGILQSSFQTGTFRVIPTLTDLAGNTSHGKAVTFKVVRVKRR